MGRPVQEVRIPDVIQWPCLKIIRTSRITDAEFKILYQISGEPKFEGVSDRIADIFERVDEARVQLEVGIAASCLHFPLHLTLHPVGDRY